MSEPMFFLPLSVKFLPSGGLLFGTISPKNEPENKHDKICVATAHTI